MQLKASWPLYASWLALILLGYQAIMMKART